MIEINGEEGGGQLLRTSLSLSVLTQKPFKITNIRKNRPQPGIKEQHLQAINAIKEVCNAKVKGAKLNSEELEFYPNEIKANNISVNISTAGSTGLILESLLLLATNQDLKIKIKGGATYGKWAPPTDYIQNILLPLLSKMNFKANIEIKRHGFFPKGGAIIKASAKKSNLLPIEITQKGQIVEIKGISVASQNLKQREVAERQAKSARKILSEYFKMPVNIAIKYSNTTCPGSGIQLWIKTKNSFIGSNSLGEISKKSEVIGFEAAKELISEYENSVIDKYAADQLLPYMAIAGNSKILTSTITNHILTNSKIIEKFLLVKFNINNNLIECERF